jgi:hypothetical protein
MYLVEGDGPLEGPVPDGQHDVVVARLLQQVVHLYIVVTSILTMLQDLLAITI